MKSKTILTCLLFVTALACGLFAQPSTPSILLVGQNVDSHLTIQGPQAAITIKPDGAVDLGANSLPEAAKAFWSGVTAAFPDFRKSILDAAAKEADAKIATLTSQVADLQAALQVITRQRDNLTPELLNAQAALALLSAKLEAAQRQAAPAATPPTP